jgi:hypothetical protein
MRKLFVAVVLVLLVAMLLPSSVAQADTDQEDACWGQASAIFAQTGEMGKHASEEPTPRLGLGNLARALYEAGVIPDDSLQALGAFVAGELGYSVDACGTGE